MSRVHDERRAAGALSRAALRQMVLPKNREKGTWGGIGTRTLLELIRAELDEVERALDNGEGMRRVCEELGDVAAFTAMALDVNGAACCCVGGEHVAHCPGWFVNDETGELERCDECAVFAGDDDVTEFVGAPVVEEVAGDHLDLTGRDLGRGRG